MKSRRKLEVRSTPVKPRAQGSARAWQRHALAVAALWAAVLLAYSNSFQAGFVFDSQRAILGDSRIQAATAQNVRQIWSEDYWAGTGSSGLYRPLSTLTYLFNYSILGDGSQPAGYHQANLAIHAVNTALVYLLGLLIFGELRPAFAFAALWALHPILTESVTNIAGRPDLLGAFGVLSGLLCYERSAGATGWRRAAWLAALAAATGIGVFSKESGAVLPGVMIVYDVAFAGKQTWPARVGAYLAASLPIGLYLLVRGRVLAQASSMVISFCDNPLLGAGFWTARLTAVKVLGKYLWLLLWPARLSSDYSYNQVPLSGWRLNGWEDAKTVLSLLLWLAVAAAAIAGFRRARPFFFFVAFFLATLAPTSNIVILIGSIMAERFLYLPSAGIAGCVVWAVWTACQRWKPAPALVPAVLALTCAALGARTYARNFDWRDERSLWTAAIQVAPLSQKAHSNLAGVLLAQSQPDYAAATGELEKALAILDDLPASRSVPSVYANAGLCYRLRGDRPKALAVLLRGREIDKAWNEAVAERNRLDGKSVSSVGTPRLYLDLGRVYLSVGQPDRALEAFRFGRAIDPLPDFFEEIAQAYHSLGKSTEEVTSLLEGVVADSTQTRLASLVVDFYRETAPQSCALTQGGGGVSLNLNCPEVRARICAASHNVVQMYLQMRDPAAASAVFQGAVKSLGCAPDMVR